jgi:hypothetical protein
MVLQVRLVHLFRLVFIPQFFRRGLCTSQKCIVLQVGFVHLLRIVEFHSASVRACSHLENMGRINPYLPETHLCGVGVSGGDCVFHQGTSS